MRKFHGQEGEQQGAIRTPGINQIFLLFARKGRHSNNLWFMFKGKKQKKKVSDKGEREAKSYQLFFGGG